MLVLSLLGVNAMAMANQARRRGSVVEAKPLLLTLVVLLLLLLPLAVLALLLPRLASLTSLLAMFLMLLNLSTQRVSCRAQERVGWQN